MAKQISQETFDNVVKENMEEFDMESEEAISDAVGQFEAQGVDLSNIVRDLVLTSGSGGDTEAKQHPVVMALQALQSAQSPLDERGVQTSCDMICAECDVDLAHRCLAASNQAFPTVFSACRNTQSRPDTFKACLQALCSLCNGQPDLLDGEAQTTSMDWLRTHRDSVDTVCLIIRFINYTCIMHETNRQSYVKSELIPVLMETLDAHKSHAGVVKGVCGCLRTLTLDDDVRVPFGKAHDHAKMIVTEAGALEQIMNICQDFVGDRGVLGELFSTLSRLAVRNEFCQRIMDLGGLTLMLETLDRNMDHQGLVKQALGVLKAIAGNDQVKASIVNNGGGELILTAMTKHALQPFICEMGCAAIATIVLRNPAHCARVMECGGADVIVKVFQLHPLKAGVQTQACMAVRNLVARTREYCTAFLDLGVEALIQKAMVDHKSCHDEAKAALRDLGCKVELKELWTGSGRGVHS